jgi:hypothetical protein
MPTHGTEVVDCALRSVHVPPSESEMVPVRAPEPDELPTTAIATMSELAGGVKLAVVEVVVVPVTAAGDEASSTMATGHPGREHHTPCSNTFTDRVPEARMPHTCSPALTCQHRAESPGLTGVPVAVVTPLEPPTYTTTPLPAGLVNMPELPGPEEGAESMRAAVVERLTERELTDTSAP